VSGDTLDRRRLLALLGALPAAAAAPSAVAAAPAPTPLPRVTAGRVERLGDFPSRHVASRNVDVWLPPGYDGSRRHAVLYMHDGQMLFDAATTWNRKAWGVDAVAAPLLAAGALRPFIVVGPWNGGAARHSEYYPQAFLDHLQPATLRKAFIDEALQGRPRADAYLRFLVEELKPAIDARYATLPRPQDTCVMGSSMGGLISVYALLSHPGVFGAAAALSTHWIATFERNAEFPAAACAWLAANLPADPARLRLYMDRGTATLDALYDDAQAKVDALLRARGLQAPGWVSEVFEGAGHDEDAWSSRLDVPLRFLFGKGDGA
jgi:enterochelin esterase-like enzyme